MVDLIERSVHTELLSDSIHHHEMWVLIDSRFVDITHQNFMWNFNNQLTHLFLGICKVGGGENSRFYANSVAL